MSKSYLKAMVLASATLAASVATAATVGPFVEVSVGKGVIATPDKYAFTDDNGIAGQFTTKRSKDYFSGRVAAGYNFMKYMGVEMAYMRPGQSTYQATNGIAKAKLTYNDNVVQALVDGYLPVDQRFDFFGKVGVAYISQTVSYQNDDSFVLPVNTAAFNAGLRRGTFHRIAPVMAIGGGWNITQSLMLDASINATAGNVDFKKKATAVANTSYIGLGVRYTFPTSKAADANA